MNIKHSQTDYTKSKDEAIVIPIFDKPSLKNINLPKLSKDAINTLNTIIKKKVFTGKLNTTHTLYLHSKTTPQCIILLGCGPKKKSSYNTCRSITGTL